MHDFCCTWLSISTSPVMELSLASRVMGTTKTAPIWLSLSLWCAGATQPSYQTRAIVIMLTQGPGKLSCQCQRRIMPLSYNLVHRPSMRLWRSWPAPCRYRLVVYSMLRTNNGRHSSPLITVVDTDLNYKTLACANTIKDNRGKFSALTAKVT